MSDQDPVTHTYQASVKGCLNLDVALAVVWPDTMDVESESKMLVGKLGKHKITFAGGKE